MKRIIVHWTAGRYKASSLDRQHYHFIFEDDGNEVPGIYSVEANRKPRKGAYAAHTLNCNTGSIGLSMACMLNATERDFGSCPMTEAQFEAMARKAAELAIQYGIRVTPQTVLSHAEVQGNLGIKQRGKWDFTVLPFRPGLKGATACGDYFRSRVISHMRQKETPAPVAFMPPEAEELIHDADKGFLESNTDKANMIASAGGLGGIGSLFAYVQDWRVQIALIVLIGLVAGAALYIFASRRRKAKLARKARVA